MDINLRNCVCVCVCMSTHVCDLHVNKWNLSPACILWQSLEQSVSFLKAGVRPDFLESRGVRSSPLWGLSFTEVQLCSLAHILSVAAFTPWNVEPSICGNGGQRLHWLQGLKSWLSGSLQKYLPILWQELCNKNSVLLSPSFSSSLLLKKTNKEKKKRKIGDERCLSFISSNPSLELWGNSSSK